MEKYFIVDENTSYVKDIKRFTELQESQRKFVNTFCKEHGVTANKFLVGGTGLMNVPFKERSIKDIRLSIVAEPEDLEKFAKQLRVPNEYNLRAFKSNSAIGKAFAQGCVANEIVINLSRPQIGDSFKSVSYHGASTTYFTYDEKNYLKISSDHLKSDDTPEGFTEIKGSEFELAREALLEKASA